MQYRRLGGSGLQVSAVGLGTNNFGGRMDYPSAERVIKKSVEVGINFIDTSNSYGRGGQSEEFIGRAVQGVRQKVLLATKVSSPLGQGPNMGGNSRQHILTEVENSLRRLQTDYIDLYQIHFWDPNTPIAETLGTLDDLVHQGKVRYIGCSNFAAWQVAEAIWTSRHHNLASFVSVQPQYSLMDRGIERELLPFCTAYHVGIIPWGPLASGFLTGKYRRGEQAPEGTRLAGNARAQERTFTERNFALLDKLELFAQERGHTVGELAVAGLLGHPEVSSVIAGATQPDQVVANARAGDWELTAGDMVELDKALRSRD